MKFKHGSRRRALDYEKDWVQRWKQDKTFEKSIENRPADDAYVFYDGPPFISGSPHHGTLLSSIIKDIIPRYQTMKGKRVERVWGWDCHGLPAERFTEKKLGIGSREEVFDYGLEKYIVACRNNMVQTSSEWNDVVGRIGRWVDMDNAYKTMDKNYMESVWWAFKELYNKGKIYEGEKVLMYCTLDATPLSKAEVTMDAGAYQDVTDPSVYVKFKLKQPGGSRRSADMTVEEVSLDSPNFAKLKEEMYITDEYEQTLRALQAEDKATVFAAVLDGRYVGRVTLRGDWADDVPKQPSVVESEYPELLQINALEVSEDYRRMGVASALMNAVEQEALRRGYDEIGLGVEISNQSAIAMYEARDYKYRPVNGRDTYDFWFGLPTPKAYVCNLMVKKLSSPMTLLAWTTTPWTLLSNTAVAVNEKLDYVEVKVGNEQFILAKELLGKVLQDEKHQSLEYTVVRELQGSDLVGLEYEPLFEHRGEGAHKVWHADYVSHEDGTGIVHIAPVYGEEDFELAKKNGVPTIHTIDENGIFSEGPWLGQNVWEVNKQIAKDLKEQGVVWKIDYIRHSYPHCHRCGTKLMYRAHPSWFMDIDGQRTEMLENNQPINWFPPHVKNGRFAKTIETAPDWNLSRDRFWATAMPVWKSESGKIKVVGSYAELKELSGVELEDYHRPWVDDVKFTIDGEEYTRIDKVIDCWFESGSMPFAQFHYPFENKEKFEANFPGDFIVEYIGQVRAWFYYVHAVNTALFGTNAFKNVIVTGNVAGNDGRKMSKSYGNYTDPNELMDKFSADSLRFLLASSPLLNGEDFALQDKEVGDVARKLSMIWNMYDFFTMYAEVDGWEFDATKPFTLNPSDLTNPLDIWIVSRLHKLNEHVTKHLDEYNLPMAMGEFLPFIDDASNWFVRRSRRRFWKSEDDGDKADAYRTLHYVLMKLSVILAPFTPFLAEELYHNMGGGNESVHLLDWPTNYSVDEAVMKEMDLVRDYVNQGLSLRAKAGLKVRQPLASVTVPYTGAEFDFVPILLDELNIKEVKLGDEVQIDETITPELRREGMMREVIRHVQATRKNAGLNVDDRIVLALKTDDVELQKAIAEHQETICTETLATIGQTTANETTAKIDGSEIAISLEHASA